MEKPQFKFKEPKVGQNIYVGSSHYISHGEDDFDGGICKIKSVEYTKGLPTDHPNYCFVVVEERPETSYNYSHLLKNQKDWKNEFGKTRGKKNPGINTPFIQEGDIVDGKVYHGPPIW